MKRICVLLVFAVVSLVSWRHSGQTEASAPAKASTEEPHKEAVTHWTAKTELFWEYPTLVAGTNSRFAVHFSYANLHRAY